MTLREPFLCICLCVHEFFVLARAGPPLRSFRSSVGSSAWPLWPTDRLAQDWGSRTGATPQGCDGGWRKQRMKEARMLTDIKLANCGWEERNQGCFGAPDCVEAERAVCLSCA
ncbi:hypothetical protein LZ31DRAFT_561549 [Colletotrichum somersetense]|nr:hypothetical protein LZ31DRAFT_561549 [Colletotrichum somersetense]